MDPFYNKAVNTVFQKLVDAKIIETKDREKYVTECVNNIKKLDMKVKLQSNTKKETVAKETKTCVYKNVKTGAPTKLCGVQVKSLVSMYCNKHHTLESTATPEIYLRVRFGSMLKDKCVDVTDKVRNRQISNLHLKSKMTIYKVFVILEAQDGHHGIYYAERRNIGWTHTIIGLIDIKESKFTGNRNLIKKTSESLSIPQCDDALAEIVLPGLEDIGDILEFDDTKSEDDNDE